MGRKKPLALVTHAHTHAEAYPGLYSMTVERFSQDLDRSDMDKLRLGEEAALENSKSRYIKGSYECNFKFSFLTADCA